MHYQALREAQKRVKHDKHDLEVIYICSAVGFQPLDEPSCS